MTEEYYKLPDDPQYSIDDIRKLQNSDPANADTVFNPLILRILENIAAAHNGAEEAQSTATAAQTTATAAQRTLTQTTVPSRTVEVAAADLPAYIAALPRLVTEDLLILVSGTLTGNLTLQGFYGSGSIRIIEKNWTLGGFTIKGRTVIEYCSIKINFEYTIFESASTMEANTGIVSVDNCASVVSIDSCEISDTTGKCRGASCSYVYMNLQNTKIHGCDTAALSSRCTLVRIEGHSERFYDNKVGVNAWQGGIAIITSPNKTLGAPSNARTEGGVIFFDGAPI